MAQSLQRPYAEFVSELHHADPVAHAVVILFNIYRGPVTVKGGKYLDGTHDPDGKPNRKFWTARLPIFRESTLRSLANQDSDNFFVVFLYEKTTTFPEGMLEDFAAQMQDELGVPFELAPIDPVDFTVDYEHAFWRRREFEEAAVRKHVGASETLYVTYLDGDDLLHASYVSELQRQEPHLPAGTQVLCVPNGFMYASGARKIRVWDRGPKGTQPPFFTLRYRSQDYLSGKRHDGGPGRHLWVAHRLKSWKVNKRLFAQHCHGANDTTAYANGVATEDLPRKIAEPLIVKGFGQR